MPQPAKKSAKRLTLTDIFHAALPGSEEVSKAAKATMSGIGSAAQDFAKDPLRNLANAFNPLEGYKATASAAREARNNPNLENIMMLIGTGMMAQPTMGAVKYRYNQHGVPAIRDPLTGLETDALNQTYFGLDDAAAYDNIRRMERLLHSSEVTEDMFTQGVVERFGLGVTGPEKTYHRGAFDMMVTPTNIPGVQYIRPNVTAALERIPTNSPVRVNIDANLIDLMGGSIKDTWGLAMEGVPGRPAVVLNPIAWPKYQDVLPHELQHANDIATNRQLFSARMNDKSWGGTGSPADAMNIFISETRADIAAKRFNEYLARKGILHWWNEPGAWPR